MRQWTVFSESYVTSGYKLLISGYKLLKSAYALCWSQLLGVLTEGVIHFGGEASNHLVRHILTITFLITN